MLSETSSLLSIEHVSKTFPGQRALHNVSLTVAGGEIHALLGHNGSGKSTLIKILDGFYRADPGPTALFNGVPIQLDRVRRNHPGMHFVHQGLGLVDQINAVENVALVAGFIRGPLGNINWSAQARLTVELLGRIGVALDVWRPVGEHSSVERAAIGIARALGEGPEGMRLLVLDEPTAAFSAREVGRLFEILNELRASGVGVLYVSHRLDEVFEIADRLSVLRDGELVGSGPVSDFNRSSLVRLMVGKVRSSSVRGEASTDATRADQDVVLNVERLTGSDLQDLSFELTRGEILGVAGIAGSGRDELPYLLTGAEKLSGGRLRLADRELGAINSRMARRLGIAFVPADRLRQGSIGQFNVRENLTLAAIFAYPQYRALTKRFERELASEWIAALSIVPGDMEAAFVDLSGGNQQKVVLSKWLSTHPVICVLAEPTSGVDVETRSVIYRFIRSAAARGTSFVICSSDTEDLVGVCGRVLVLRDGAIAAQLEAPFISEAEIVAAMFNTKTSTSREEVPHV